MIAADTGAWIDYSKGAPTEAAKRLEACLVDGALAMPLPVLFEVLGGPGLTADAERLLRALPRLDCKDEYWERAGAMRRALLKKSLKARSMDCLIAQVCIDHDVPLIAADHDYRHFARFGLRLETSS